MRRVLGAPSTAVQLIAQPLGSFIFRFLGLPLGNKSLHKFQKLLPICLFLDIAVPIPSELVILWRRYGTICGVCYGVGKFPEMPEID